MREELVSVDELSRITGLHASTLRPWLDTAQLCKYVSFAKLNGRYKVAVKLNKRFAYRICEFFMKYGKEDAIARVEKYFEDRDNGSKWFWYL